MDPRELEVRDGQRPVQRYGPVEIGLRARKVASEQCDVPEVEPPQRLTGVIRYSGAQLALCARRVAEKFAGTPYTRNQGIIDSRPGAGGQIALNMLKTAPADGSVLAMTPFSAISRCA